jgi:glycerol-3-phosphate dehydrogenase (NAD(P)+)
MKEDRQVAVSVLGAGSWGTTLALHLAQFGGEIKLWEFATSRAAEVATSRLSLPFVPDHPLPANIEVTSDLKASLTGTDFILMVVPSHAVIPTAEAICALQGEGLDLSGKQWVSATKGLDEETGRSASQLLSDQLAIDHSEIVVLAGPNLAKEVLASLPTATLASATNLEAAIKVQKAFYSPSFRIYTNTDPLGVEIGVSLKNIIAIAAGITEGLELGRNAMGTLLTRGLAEISRLGQKMGAERETFLGLAGIGDLVTTCTSPLSRNHQVGRALAEGRSLEQILDEMVMVAEGVKTTRSAHKLSKRLAVEMPITEQIHQVLFDGKDPRRALEDLMGRPQRQEFWGEATNGHA